ncbi:MAG TPA: glycosyltransferase [Alphaproteobacteria bacterium]|nr:glycosyltransferase [Alphaproteobacteria bacterium]
MKVLIAIRGWFKSDDKTLDVDIGPRFTRAIQNYGWEAHYHRLPWPYANDYSGTIEACREIRPDVLLWDDDYILNPAELLERRSFMSAVRLLGVKIVPVYLDGWALREAVVREASKDVDAIWAVLPSFSFWNTLGVPVLHFPIPHGVVIEPDDTKPIKASFCGRIAGHHKGRLEFMGEGSPIEWDISDFKNEDKDPLQAYANYMARLGRSGAALSFCMRWLRSERVVTDRVFEAPLAGALLIQEYAPCVAHFMKAGQHFLEFTTPADLREILNFIEAKPEEAKAIRRAGHEHVVASYCDQSIIKQFEGLLNRCGQLQACQASPAVA